MRSATAAALSAAVLLSAPVAFAQDAPAAPAAPAPASAPTDAELASFAKAMSDLRAVTAEVQGEPTVEQQVRMAAAVENSGLEVERFNAISALVSADPVLQARAAVAGAEPSAPGSVGAGATEAEIAQFVDARAEVVVVARALNGAAPTAEQQAQMASAITDAGLTVERFNAISTAAADDEHLAARVALAEARDVE